MSTSETITRTDLTNILNEVLPCPAPVTFLGKIASVDFKGTSTSWEYTGMSFTVPAGHRYLVCLYNNWNSGKPIGIGINYTSTLGNEGYPYFSFENANGFSTSPTWSLNAGTYYVFSKRYSVPSLANNHAVYAWDFHSGVMPVTDLQADYIVEQGTSGIWTYRKWNSGIAECWGRHSWAITGWSAWGSIYETNTSYATYPTSFFVATPTVSLTHRCLSGGEGIIGVETTSGESETRTATMYLIRPVAAGGTNQTGYVDIYARGRWKE